MPPAEPTTPLALLMPLKGDCTAPTFDPASPHTLPRYLSQVDRLLARSKIDDPKECKDYIISFIEPDLQDLWEAFPEYSDATKTFEDFKEALLHSYTDKDNRYDMRELDQLIGECQRLGIHNLQDLTAYHLRFCAITNYLIKKNRLGIADQFNAYVRGFNPVFWNTVLGRLHIKHPDHRLNQPYTIDEVYEAARFVLDGIPVSSYHGTLPALTAAPVPPTFLSPTTIQPLPTSPATSPTPPPDQKFIKTEELGAILSKFYKDIIEAINAQPRGRANRDAAVRQTDCNFCGKAHYIRDCELVDEYIRAGKCKRNSEGKVVLPTGAFIPRDIPGTLLRERFDEWHRCNPNQLAVPSSTMMHTIIDPPGPTSSYAHTHMTYQLSATDHIASLEAELFALKARRPGFTLTILTRGQKKARNTSTEFEDEELDRPAPPPVPAEPTRREKSSAPATTPTPPPPADVSVAPTDPAPVEPEHPFRNAQDATYAPPQSRNFRAPFKAPANKKPDVAYRNAPPIYSQEHAKELCDRALKTPLTITHGELLSIAPEVRARFREAITSRRNPTKEDAAESHLYADGDRYIEFYFAPTIAYQHRSPPPGTTVIPDPIETYYRGLAPGEEPDMEYLTVAKESHALRSIFPLVDNSQKIECVLDPGCQIVAMSENISHRLGIGYDPDIILHMLSANGTIDRSLGLARNVPFTLNGLTFYMQVHVIRSPAYEILLGRPFDVLAQSVVRNFTNAEQTITNHDPNTHRTVTVPTMPHYPPCRNGDEEVLGFRE